MLLYKEKKELTNKDGHFFALARVLASTSSYHGTHAGAILVYKGVAISFVTNGEKEHPFWEKAYDNYKKMYGDDGRYPTGKLPPEISCICLAMNENVHWSKTSLYVFKQMKNSKPCVSKPTDNCQRLIQDLCIPYVIYTDGQGNCIKDHYIYSE